VPDDLSSIAAAPCLRRPDNLPAPFVIRQQRRVISSRCLASEASAPRRAITRGTWVRGRCDPRGATRPISPKARRTPLHRQLSGTPPRTSALGGADRSPLPRRPLGKAVAHGQGPPSWRRGDRLGVTEERYNSPRWTSSSPAEASPGAHRKSGSRRRDTKFSALTESSAMVETMPLEKAAEALRKMMPGRPASSGVTMSA